MGLTWLTFVARDILPLTTYTIRPVDGDLGAPLWIYIGIMTVAAVIVPLFVPRPYIPYDPKVCFISVSYPKCSSHVFLLPAAPFP